jgi:hypothetical protein
MSGPVRDDAPDRLVGCAPVTGRSYIFKLHTFWFKNLGRR